MLLHTACPSYAHHWVKLWFIVSAGSVLAFSSAAAPVQPIHPPQETGITMTGRCPNGEAYRLVSYEKEVEGFWKSFYDYQGPVGRGTVQTRTGAKVMVSRVCIALAEIASDE